MSLPKLSIITPSFNQGQFIEQTILSIIEQDYPNIEHIIIDGGSTDNTIDIIKKYEKNITYWISEQDKGQSDAINKGMKLATGEIVNWLNSDDYYMPGALYHVATKFSNPNITAYCGRSRIFSGKSEYISQGTDIYQGNLAKTIGWARIDQPETFFRRTVWNEIGFLNENFHYIMDKEWWIRYLLRYGLSGLEKDEEILVNFRIHENSKTGSQQEKFIKETIELFYSLADKYGYSDGVFQMYQGLSIKPLFGYTKSVEPSIEKIISYFSFKLFLEAYAQNDFALANLLKRRINISYLGKKDKYIFTNINLRLKLIPVKFKKWYNLHVKL